MKKISDELIRKALDGAMAAVKRDQEEKIAWLKRVYGDKWRTEGMDQYERDNEAANEIFNERQEEWRDDKGTPSSE